MAKTHLIDTSAVIKYLNQTFSSNAISFIDKIIDEQSCISFISEIELQAWQPENEDDLKIYKQFVETADITGITKAIIEKTIDIRRETKIKIADAIIAATAITNSLTLVADNDKDFKKVKGLNYINPKNL